MLFMEEILYSLPGVFLHREPFIRPDTLQYKPCRYFVALPKQLTMEQTRLHTETESVLVMQIQF